MRSHEENCAFPRNPLSFIITSDLQRAFPNWHELLMPFGSLAKVGCIRWRGPADVLGKTFARPVEVRRPESGSNSSFRKLKETMMQSRSRLITTSVVALFGLAGCATESSQALSVPPPVPVQASAVQSLIKVSVGKFDNRSTYMRGIFS